METSRENYLRERREKAGFSQKNLGQAVDRSGTSISRYETGERGIAPSVARELANVLRIEPHELFIEPTGK